MTTQPALRGAHTAIVTPFDAAGKVAWSALEKLIAFQIDQGIDGLVACGTTGESPTLDWDEHEAVIARSIKAAAGKVPIMAGVGSNNTKEAIDATRHAKEAGAASGLLVDCYYNGPSSGELRAEYYEAVAAAVPGFPLVPYVIPGRTGCALSAEDLALLVERRPQYVAVKEATGDLDRMARTRGYLPQPFSIMSGDDDVTLGMMSRPDIAAQGVISVMTNLTPGPIAQMVRHATAGEWAQAEALIAKLTPLFKIITVTVDSTRQLKTGKTLTVKDKFRNPAAIKTIMAGLGMNVGPMRAPMGKMNAAGIQAVRGALKQVNLASPELLAPVGRFYNVDIAAKIADDKNWAALTREY
ncbi:MAG: 4-hydroxy-tetrahydrodipicolinate synthase [Planctomycetota bacterium]